ncbi:uncharacterized protein [Physcomitrium patens]|uniref:uncharacterized protein isoform X2 n=1 Tax=Physcomitrium patens TaxID=3218 RepID=UPI003CCD8FB7
MLPDIARGGCLVCCCNDGFGAGDLAHPGVNQLVSPSGDRVAWRRGGVVNLYWRSTTLWGLKRILSPMMATLTGSCVFRLCSW